MIVCVSVCVCEYLCAREYVCVFVSAWMQASALVLCVRVLYVGTVLLITPVTCSC